MPVIPEFRQRRQEEPKEVSCLGNDQQLTLAAKPGDSSSIPGTCLIGGESDSYKEASSDLHTGAVACTCVHTYTRYM